MSIRFTALSLFLSLIAANASASSINCVQSDGGIANGWSYSHSQSDGGPAMMPVDKWFLSGSEASVSAIFKDESMKVIGKKKKGCYETTAYSEDAVVKTVDGDASVSFDCISRFYVIDNKKCFAIP